MTKWDERYRSGYGVGGAAEPALVNAVSVLSPGRALDLACGLGRNALYLASLGWKVTALDSSQVAINALPDSIEAVCVDLELPEFQIAPESYDLICDCYYLQRDLFPKIRNALKPGGLFVAVIPMADDDPAIRPMNPDFLCRDGELHALFDDWEILHQYEGKPGGDTAKRRVSELVARKPVKVACEAVTEPRI
jgi:tellurite methyltransferase